MQKRIIFTSFLIIVFLTLPVFMCNKNEAPKQETVQEIHWITNLDSALVLSESRNKTLMIDFMATWCPPCRAMEDSTFSHSDVIQKSSQFIPVRIDVDKQGDIADKYNSNAGKYGGIGIPNILFMASDGKKLKHPIGYKGPEDFVAIMDSVLNMME